MSTGLDLSGAKILVVDDVPANLDLLVQALETAGYNISVAPGGEVALRVVRNDRPDLILLDVVMPEMDGYEVCRRLKAEAETRIVPVIFLTARGETEEVVEGFRAGGVDYIVKPFQQEEVLARIEMHLERTLLARVLTEKNQELEQRTRDLQRANRALEEEMARRQALAGERNHLAKQLSMISRREAEHWGVAGFVGRSPTVREVLREINLLRNAEAMSVLITGESGTGKELLARAIHFGSSRSEGAFVPINCATIPGDLAESLLFGHTRGAFTGADEDRTGYFDLADGGTLFLDEMGEMPPDLQAKLLRVLDDGQILPLGARAPRSVNVRIIAATNADLQNRIAAGAFREDLYFRLARFTVHVPPLRERREDIPLLAQHFLVIFAGEMGREVPSLSLDGLEALNAYPFPGNVRELKNVMERALLESGGGEIRPEHLHFLRPLQKTEGPSEETDAPDDLTLPDFEHEELERITEALKQTEGNIAAAARLLGMDRSRIYRKLRKHGLR